VALRIPAQNQKELLWKIKYHFTASASPRTDWAFALPWSGVAQDKAEAARWYRLAAAV
jgi:hypothetical protein